MPHPKQGKAIRSSRLTGEELAKLIVLQVESKRDGDLATWRRAKAVLGYLQNKSVISLSGELDVTRGSINRWLQWFDADGTDGLRPRERPGGAPRLDEAQREELVAIIEAGPQASGFMTGLWTGPMIGDVIRRRFGVSYHNHHVPRLLHKLGFSVQRPRKRLARADLEKQRVWLDEKFPAIKKKRRLAVGWFSGKTKPVSGSTEPSTGPGRASGVSLASTPSASERPPTSSEP